MTRLQNWTAKRSGTGMTVFRRNPTTGAEEKISNVKTIEYREHADVVVAVVHAPDGEIVTIVLPVRRRSI